MRAPTAPSASPAHAAPPRRPEAPPVAARALVYPHARIVATLDVDAVRAAPIAGSVFDVLRRAAPFRDLDGALDPQAVEWVVLATPSLHPNPRSSFVLRATGARGSVARAMDSLERFDTGAPNVRGAHAVVDGAPHVVLLRDDGLLAIVPGDEAERVAQAIARSKVDPQLSGDLLDETILRPSTMNASIPESVLAARVVAKAGSPVRVHVTLDCAIEQEAVLVARELDRRAKGAGGPFAGATIASSGNVVSIDLDLTPELIRALASP